MKPGDGSDDPAPVNEFGATTSEVGDWILVTNDDGIDAPGIQILARALVAAGFEIKIIAPDENYSGASASLGSLSKQDPIPTVERELPGLDGVFAVAVGAPPAGCTMLGMLGGFGETTPSMVVSGINSGANAGRAIVFSGTIGAAQAGVVLGIPGVAVSLAEKDSGEDLLDEHYELAAALAVDLVRAVQTTGTERPFTYNLNVPSLDRDDLLGVAGAEPATMGNMQTTIRAVTDAGIETAYGRTDVVPPASTDAALLRSGWATVSVIGRPESFDPTAVVAAMVASP